MRAERIPRRKRFSRDRTAADILPRGKGESIMKNKFARLTSALFGRRDPPDAATEACPPGKLPSADPLVRFWEAPDPPWHITLTDAQAVDRRFRSAIDTALLIGLSGDMDICVNYDRSVSRRHCEILREGDLFYIVNHSRSNGTQLNHREVTGKTPVADGDLITMGRVELRLEIDG